MEILSEHTREFVADELRKFIDAAGQAAGGDHDPIKPAHRVPFHWPPHPVSADYHILASDWTGKATFEADGKEYEVSVARTGHGFFGRVDELWNESRGETMEEMMDGLRESAEPLFMRQRAIARVIGQDGRFEGDIHGLGPADLVKLLFCEDRDVAHEAQVEVETHASSGIFGDALVMILKDSVHQHRRSAQWCVLDMFEDLPSFCKTEDQMAEAIDAIGELIWTTFDDYARTVYKAGVVLGGHICTDHAADVLISCIDAPTRIGRRSAIHAVFHLAEWMPRRKGQIVTALRNAAATDDEPKLREFAQCMARDIEAGAIEHVTEPLFDDEP